MRLKVTDPEQVRKCLPSGLAGWCVGWLLLVVAIVAAGAVAGALLYPLFGTLLGMDLSVREMFLNGVLDGGFYAMIWAPGVSFVACLMGANWKRRGAAN
jgi:amino acid transporter